MARKRGSFRTWDRSSTSLRAEQILAASLATRVTPRRSRLPHEVPILSLLPFLHRIPIHVFDRFLEMFVVVHEHLPIFSCPTSSEPIHPPLRTVRKDGSPPREAAASRDL